MINLGEKEYTQLVAEKLTEVYGEFLREYGTDVEMAEAVVKMLKKYLTCRSGDISEEEYQQWKKMRKEV